MKCLNTAPWMNIITPVKEVMFSLGFVGLFAGLRKKLLNQFPWNAAAWPEAELRRIIHGFGWKESWCLWECNMCCRSNLKSESSECKCGLGNVNSVHWWCCIFSAKLVFSAPTPWHYPLWRSGVRASGKPPRLCPHRKHMRQSDNPLAMLTGWRDYCMDI